ncbi:MAG: hypothetical protein PHR09_00500 [Bacilli bacterium]|nr:hypothetical protein [Bacilli bacterium]
MDKDKLYRELLKKQFISAKGIRNEDESDAFKIDLEDWLSSRLGLAEDVFSFFDYLGYEYEGVNNIEVGKGLNDSIFYNRIESTLITPFVKGLKNQINPTIEGDIKVSGDNPIIVNKKKTLIEISQINSDKFDNLIIYNPYNIEDLNKWDNIHNYNKKINIIVGIFGFINDKDKDIKIKQLNDFKSLLSNKTYKYALETNDYTYLGAIGPDEWDKEFKILRK